MHSRKLKMLSLLALLFSGAPGFADSSKIVTAAQVNGTWRAKGGSEFKIWALGNQKLQVMFDGVYEYKSQWGPMANLGEVDGIATIEGDTAQFNPDHTKDCLIVLKFVGNQLIATHATDLAHCGFGMNVSAEGNYRKINGRKPSFKRNH